jgi:hypothetical protein
VSERVLRFLISKVNIITTVRNTGLWATAQGVLALVHQTIHGFLPCMAVRTSAGLRMEAGDAATAAGLDQLALDWPPGFFWALAFLITLAWLGSIRRSVFVLMEIGRKRWFRPEPVLGRSLPIL